MAPQEELLEYLELRQRLKEDIRKKRKNELGSANGLSPEINKALPRNYGLFFGPSQPAIAQRVFQECKSLMENPNFVAKVVMKSNHPNEKGSKSVTNSNNAPKVTNELKTKVQMLKNNRDYSFLLSDDAELPAPSKAALVALPPSNQQSSSNTGRKLLKDRVVRKPIPRNKLPTLHKPAPSKLQPSKEILQSGKSKVMPKQAEPSYKHKPIMKKQAAPSSNATRSLENRRPARKPKRKHDDEEHDGAEAISMIRRMFRYNPNRYQDEDDTSHMEANFDDILREEKRSAKIAKKEDQEELRKIEDEERRERLRKQAKKRKLSHQ